MRVVIQARQAGKTAQRMDMVERAVLALIFDRGGTMPFAELWRALPCTRREIFWALDRQCRLGNVKRHRTGEPIVLTSSAMAAIAAGREVLELAA